MAFISVCSVLMFTVKLLCFTEKESQMQLEIEFLKQELENVQHSNRYGQQGESKGEDTWNSFIPSFKDMVRPRLSEIVPGQEQLQQMSAAQLRDLVSTLSMELENSFLQVCTAQGCLLDPVIF